MLPLRARGILGQRLEVEGAREVRRFREDNREARIGRRDGEPSRAFPFGTYKERVVHGAPVKRVPEAGEAAIAMPGPTLADIEAKLKASGPKDSDVAAAQQKALIDETREALSDESEALCSHAQDEVGEFRECAQDRQVVVRRRFDRHEPKAGSDVRRVVTHRHRRRGRPAAARHHHGADPPG